MSQNQVCVKDLLLVPKANSNLLGRDLVVTLRLTRGVEQSISRGKVYTLTSEDETEINPIVWSTPENHGEGRNRTYKNRSNGAGHSH